jgi:hypothetical protein
MSKGGEKHLSPERAPGTGPLARPAARPDHIRRTSSAGRFMNEKKRAAHSSKSASRSRRRDTAGGAGLTTANAKRGGKPRVQLGAIRRRTRGGAPARDSLRSKYQARRNSQANVRGVWGCFRSGSRDIPSESSA